MTMGVPQWVTDRLQPAIDQSNMSIAPTTAQPVSATQQPLDPALVAGIQAAYGSPGPAQLAPQQAPMQGQTEQQYLESAAAEELARRRSGQATALPPALARVTPIQQSAPGVVPPPPVTPGPPATPGQTAATDDPSAEPGALSYLTAAYTQGSQQRVPEQIAKVGEQYQQRGFGALPGDVTRPLPNRPIPGLDDPTPEQLGAPLIDPRTKQPMRVPDAQGNASGELLYKGTDGKPEAYGARYQRLMTQNAASRPVTASQPSQFDQAQTAQRESEDEALLTKRLELQSQAEQADQREREAVLVGRGLAEREAELRRDDEARRVLIDKHVGEIDQLIQKRSAEVQQNPVTKYWQDKGLLGRIGVGIAIGMGAAGQALAGGQNAALEMIGREIDGEVMRQRQIVDSLGTVIAAKRTVLGDLLSKFRDPAAADHAARAIFSAQIENMYRKQAARESSNEMRAAMSSVADALAMQREQQRLQSIGAERTAAYAWQPARVVGQVGGLAGLTKLAKDLSLTPEQERRLKLEYVKGGPRAAEKFLTDSGLDTGTPSSTAEVSIRNWDLGRRVQLPGNLGGQTLWAPSDDGRKSAQMGLNSASQILMNLQRLRKIVMSGSRLSPDDVATVDQIASQNTAEYKNAWELGVLSDSDRDLIAPLTGASVAKMSLVDRSKLLDNAESLTRQSIQKYTGTLYSDPNGSKLYQPQIVTRKAK